MNIAFIDPLSRAWNRMTTALFRPFDIGKWFVVGFTAFLAGLTDGPNGGGSGGGNGKGRFNFDEVIDFPHTAWDWLMDNSLWFTLIILGVFFLIFLIVLFTWLSSRGKFMFLDNVVHNRAKVTQPWYEYKREGNSLFLWRLVFSLICIAVFILLAIQIFILVTDIYEQSYSRHIPILSIVGMGLLTLLIILTIAYISLFLDAFVVPIMYKHNVTTTQAWGRFLPILSQHWFYFIGYGLLMLFLYILAFIVVIMAGFFTCCIGIILLIIPYINSVVTLPISYTFRAFGPEFLAQFGSEFDVFPHPENLPGSIAEQ